MSQGIVYIAVGEEYVEEALHSAASAREHGHATSIITSEAVWEHPDEELEPLDHIVVADDLRGGVGDKVYSLEHTPYDRTVFLDTDTLVLGDLSPLFTLLDRVDVACARSPSTIVDLLDVPDAFPELNTGVIAYDDSEAVSDLFERWQTFYEQQIREGYPDATIRVGDPSATTMKAAAGFGRRNDQPAFRRAVYKTDVDYSIVPREYNFRGPGASAYDRVRVVHGRSMVHNETFLSAINESLRFRCLWDGTLYRWDAPNVSYDGELPYVQPAVDKLLGTLPVGDALRTLGVHGTAVEAYDRIRRSL